MSGYEALADLAERELELVRAGNVDALAALREERHAIIAKLPATPPPGARPALERAAALQARVSEALGERVRQLGTELGRLSQGRTAMRGYTPQVEPLKLVDRAG
jgi:hypothetical protein